MKDQRRRTFLQQVLTTAVLLALCIMVGCLEWTEDPQGNLRSLGLPGVPVWQSQATPALSPTDMGLSPEEAAKVSGPMLVQPPDSTSRLWRYRYYPAGQNHCQEDLQKMLEERAQLGVGGADPYCAERPAAPSASGKSPGSGS